MKIGVVVHGPNIIDSGYVVKIIDLLKEFGDVSCRLGGTMGRTAVIDNFLEDTINISRKLVPSDSIKLFHEDNVDVIFLLNYGKSHVTGQVFGYKVVNHFLNKIEDSPTPIIQIERPGEEDGSVILWTGDCADLTSEIADKLNLKIVTPEEIYNEHFKQDNVNNAKKERIVHGVSPDENIMVNSVVIGKSNSDKLTLIAENGYIVDIKGGVLKEHGLEKLGKIDLDKAIIKTGLLRKAKVTPRVINTEHSSDLFRIAFLDHAGEDVYKYKDVDVVVTIGDDTTLISSDILYRFNIPIMGITDGDLDKVVEDGFKADKSVIFELESGHDDIVGAEIFNKIFKGNFVLELPKSKSNISDIKKSIIEILNNINCKYNIKDI